MSFRFAFHSTPIFQPMKNILSLALLVGTATLAAQPALAQTGPAPTSKKEMKQQRKARKQTGPEVYKGTVAEQSRIITDAAGSEKDRDESDATSTKKSKRKN